MSANNHESAEIRRNTPKAERIGELVSLLMPGFRASGFCSGKELGELALEGILCIAESMEGEAGKILFLVLSMSTRFSRCRRKPATEACEQKEPAPKSAGL